MTPTPAEDTASPAGATVGSLFSGNFSDAADAVVGGSSADTFAGIAPASVPGFVVAQGVGGLLAVAAIGWFYPHAGESADDVVVPHEHPARDTTPGSTR